MRADSLDLPHTLRVLFTNCMDQVRPVRLPMSLYNLSDSTEGKLRALQIRSRILQARPWSLLLRSWDAGLESSLCAFIYAKRSWNELFRVVTKVLTETLLLKDQSAITVGDFSWSMWVPVSLSGLTFSDVTFFFHFHLIHKYFQITYSELSTGDIAVKQFKYKYCLGPSESYILGMWWGVNWHRR